MLDTMTIQFGMKLSFIDWKRFNGIDFYCFCWVGRGTVLAPQELREENRVHQLPPFEAAWIVAMLDSAVLMLPIAPGISPLR